MIFDDLDNNEIIQFKKDVSKLIKKAHSDSAPDRCIICDEEIKGTCNSHIVPQMILKQISKDGMLLQANSAWDTKVIDKTKGINNSGIFHYICTKCDNTVFQDYEDEYNISNYPSNRMLVEIALKNLLSIYSKRVFEIQHLTNLLQMCSTENEYYFDTLRCLNTYKLDLRDYWGELDLCKNYIRSNEEESIYDLFVWEKLPYKCPIATQSILGLYKDMNGNIVNNIYDYNKANIIENMHICIFPLKQESIVMAFSLKDNKKYRNFKYQIKHSIRNDKLAYLNWCVFKYCEDYFISPKIEAEINSNEVLRKLSRENGVFPDFGIIDVNSKFDDYRLISYMEIPNFLEEKWAI